MLPITSCFVTHPITYILFVNPIQLQKLSLTNGDAMRSNVMRSNSIKFDSIQSYPIDKIANI